MKKKLLFTLFCLFVFCLSAQTRTIEVHPNNRVSSILMTESEYNVWISQDHFKDQSKRESLTQDLYLKFRDDFDFIFFVLNEDQRPSNLPYGELINVSNNVLGIGRNEFSLADSYGSDGKLQAIIQLTQRDFLLYGPSLHELMHNWGNYGIPTESVSAPGSNLVGFNFIPHWGFTGGSTKGQLGGFEQGSLIRLGSGSFRVDSFSPFANGGNSVPYNELELYLMGMIPIDQVSDFSLFNRITSLTVSTSTFDFEATEIPLNSQNLEGFLGKRNPSFTESQKEFNSLVVILTKQPINQEQWDLVDQQAEQFSMASDLPGYLYNFWEATNGVGQINMSNLDKSLIDQTLGIDEEKLDKSVKFYPNPISNILSIKTETIIIQKVEIYSSLGIKMYEIDSGFEQIQTDNLSNGIYIIKIYSEKGSTTRRLIKQ